MWLALMISMTCAFVAVDRAESQPVRGAFPSPSVQILPLMVAQEKGFYKREGLDLELVFVRGASTAVQALLANQIHFIFSVGPQMPAVWEGSDIILLAQQVAANLFADRDAGYPEDCRSQRKENRRHFRGLDRRGYESLVGAQ